MPFEIDHENESVLLTVGEGDVLVDAQPGKVLLSDLGQSCSVGSILNDCLEQNVSTDRVVEIRGSNNGLRTVIRGLVRACVSADRTGPLPETLRECVLCGQKKVRLVDTGAFCLCEVCLADMVSAMEESDAE